MRGYLGRIPSGLGTFTTSHRLRDNSLHPNVARYYNATPAPTPAPDLPIIINGAGAAGLVLARMLQLNKIRFELCERDIMKNGKQADITGQSKKEITFFGLLHRQTSRNYRVTLNPSTLRLLVDRLQIADVRRFLNWIGDGVESFNASTQTIEKLLSHSHNVHMRKLAQFLQKGLLIRYIHTLHHEGIMLKGDANHAKFKFERELSSFEGRMMVGADGKFSSVRAQQLGKWPVENRLFSCPLIFYQTRLAFPQSLFRDEIRPHLDSSLSASSLLPNSFRLYTEVKEYLRDIVFLNLRVSRPSRSPKDFHEFYGLHPNQTDTPRVDEYYSGLISRELNEFGTLPKPFDILYRYAQTYPSVSQKVLPEGIILEKEDLPTKVSVRGVSIPAVIIGDAAHCLPSIFRGDDINHVLRDAIELGDLIGARTENKALFNRIPYDFYAKVSARWVQDRRNWESRMAMLHGVENDMDWTRITKVHRRFKARFPSKNVRPDMGPGKDVRSYWKAISKIDEQAKEKYLRWCEAREYRDELRGKIEAMESKGQAKATGQTKTTGDKDKPLIAKYAATWW